MGDVLERASLVSPDPGIDWGHLPNPFFPHLIFILAHL